MTISDDPINRLAQAIYDALASSGSTAIIEGDPLIAEYHDGDLIDGVTLDGLFDFKKAASLLHTYLERQKNEP
ncbi:hypothetical protein [Mesorhizobium sp. GbtcB19]|uniref:hypothetical protein n=1 Tax=Mesorhizobium sp. GbtcB19 TaxID=2824764 RepID=UPI001C30BB12|nr:hypothetical protein [Mesorhizobium sp. GbtcB19]